MNEVRIPILDLRAEIEEHRGALMAAVERVLRSGRFILGPEVEGLEHEVAEYLGMKHGVGVNSGTDALVIGLRALGIEPGDEVITTPFTFFSTPESISNAGATPVFVDIDPVTYNIDPAQIELAVNERTRAIMPVHIYGQACDMDAIMEIARRYDLRVLEDTAQAMGGAWRGKKLATIGDAGALSFFPSKNLGGFGDGGMLVTDNDEVAEVARMLRAHGSKQKYANEVLGYNSRLDELQAALLRVRLPHLDHMNDRRRANAFLYDEALSARSDVITPQVRMGAEHVYHQYTVRIPGRRDEMAESLGHSGVTTVVYYPKPIHQLPIYRPLNLVLPQAERAAAEVLSLPMGASLSPASIERIASVIG